VLSDGVSPLASIEGVVQRTLDNMRIGMRGGESGKGALLANPILLGKFAWTRSGGFGVILSVGLDIADLARLQRKGTDLLNSKYGWGCSEEVHFWPCRGLKTFRLFEVGAVFGRRLELRPPTARQGLFSLH